MSDIAARFILLASIGLVIGCAQQRAPTGGPPDTTPPEVVSSTPENYSTHFSANRIVIEFDEYVQPNNINDQLVVSPPLEKDPVLVVRGRQMTVDLEGSLRDSTTYTFNFGAGIRDYTEGNTVTDLLYVVSTGDFIDSLEVKGRVTDGLTGSAEDQMLVMLYKGAEDSLPRTTLPRYFDRTDKDGTFHIRNIAEGSYRIFALKDGNLNYLYDNIDERIAFLDSSIRPVVVDSTYEPLRMYSFARRDTSQFITNTKTFNYGAFVAGFNLPTTPRYELNIKKGEGSIQDWSWINKRGDSLKVWVTGTKNVEQINIPLFADTLALDTIKWYLPKANKRDSASFQLSSNIQKNRIDQGENLTFELLHPIQNIDTTRFNLLADSTEVDFEVLYSDTALRRLEVAHKYTTGKKYDLQLLPGAVRDIYGNSNDSLDLRFSIYEDNYYGALVVKLGYDEANSDRLILQLISESGEVIKERFTKGDAEETFTKLKPATYNLRLIVDRNGSGEWDPGNYSQKLQPEPAFSYPEALEVRSNWTIESEWNF